MPANLENSAVVKDWQRQVLIPIPKTRPKNVQTTAQLHSLHISNKVMHKILQAILQQYMNWGLPMLKLDLEKAEEPEMKVPISVGSLKKHENFRKTSTSPLLTTPKSLTLWITANCRNSQIDGNARCPYLPPEKSVCRSRSINQNWTWSNRLVPS